jgi:hypothetical protein
VTEKRVLYADPPYPGMSGLYKEHEDYGGEVNHFDLCSTFKNYDGWILHTASTTLPEVLEIMDDVGIERQSYRIMAWVKPFAAFKKNVPIPYTWEPVLVSPCRKMEVRKTEIVRDHLAERITTKRGLTGAKPEKVCWWLFDCAGMAPGDLLEDRYYGTGAVSRAYQRWTISRSSEPEQLEMVNE